MDNVMPHDKRTALPRSGRIAAAAPVAVLSAARLRARTVVEATRNQDGQPVVLLVGFDRAFARSLHAVAHEHAAVKVAYTAVPPRDIPLVLGPPPDVILLCWETVDAVLLQELVRAKPGTGVVLLAHRLSRAQARALQRCGAAAVLERAVPARVLVSAVILAAHGLRVEPVPPGKRPSRIGAGSGAPQLSDRETEVLGLLECGESTSTIAGLLGVSVHTVKSQARCVYRKLGVHSRAELLRRGHDDLIPFE